MEKTPLRFIRPYIIKFRWYFLFIILLIFVRQIAEAVSPYYLAKIYETVAEAKDKAADNMWNNLLFYAFLFAAIMLAGTLISELSMFIIARFIPKMRTMVIKDTFEDVNRQSISFFTREMTGNISGKVQLLANNTLDLTGDCHEIFYTVSIKRRKLALLFK